MGFPDIISMVKKRGIRISKSISLTKPTYPPEDKAVVNPALELGVLRSLLRWALDVLNQIERDGYDSVDKEKLNKLKQAINIRVPAK